MPAKKQSFLLDGGQVVYPWVFVFAHLSGLAGLEKTEVILKVPKKSKVKIKKRQKLKGTLKSFVGMEKKQK